MNELRDNNTILHAHEIETIKINQDIIKRMANNSQHIKNLFMLLTGAILSLLGTKNITGDKSIIVVLGFVFIGLIFWIMDAKYLRLERLFREHHKAIVNGSIGYKQQFSFNPMAYSKKHSTIKAMLDGFSILLYPSCIITICLVGFMIGCVQ